MTRAHDPPRPVLFTIGHSNHSQEAFLDLLRMHSIDVLVDVRSQPYSRYAKHFNAEPIRQGVTGAGIRYMAMGKQLGGRPDDAAFYDQEGHVLYRLVAASPVFLDGIERLEKGIAQYRVAIMCSEEDPAVCHRHLLVGRVMAGRGVDVCHIRGDGRLQSDAELAVETGGDSRQPMLFQELEKESWRSLRSVLPKPVPPSSSES
jgi:uncharacterized protein (DUF488 family)